MRTSNSFKCCGDMSVSHPEIVEVAEPVRTAAGWQPLTVGAGPIGAHLVNGVFGDPLLEVKFKSRRERLLFDLGDAAMLSRRVLHTVTDVFPHPRPLRPHLWLSAFPARADDR